MYKFKYLLTLLITFSVLSKTFSQQRKPYIENFTPKNYWLSNHVQNWAVIQGNDGILYFGNRTKVLQYNGLQWKNIRITPNEFILSLAKVFDNRIYLVSINEFGYINIDERG